MIRHIYCVYMYVPHAGAALEFALCQGVAIVHLHCVGSMALGRGRGSGVSIIIAYKLANMKRKSQTESDT